MLPFLFLMCISRQVAHGFFFTEDEFTKFGGKSREELALEVQKKMASLKPDSELELAPESTATQIATYVKNRVTVYHMAPTQTLTPYTLTLAIP